MLIITGDRLTRIQRQRINRDNMTSYGLCPCELKRAMHCLLDSISQASQKKTQKQIHVDTCVILVQPRQTNSTQYLISLMYSVYPLSCFINMN